MLLRVNLVESDAHVLKIARMSRYWSCLNNQTSVRIRPVNVPIPSLCPHPLYPRRHTLPPPALPGFACIASNSGYIDTDHRPGRNSNSPISTPFAWRSFILLNFRPWPRPTATLLLAHLPFTSRTIHLYLRHLIQSGTASDHAAAVLPLSLFLQPSPLLLFPYTHIPSIHLKLPSLSSTPPSLSTLRLLLPRDHSLCQGPMRPPAPHHRNPLPSAPRICQTSTFWEMTVTGTKLNGLSTVCLNVL